jgi:ABC-type amino acid transport substrate-binding protein
MRLATVVASEACVAAPVAAAVPVAGSTQTGTQVYFLQGEQLVPERYGVVLQKGSQLTDQVDAAVRGLVANGTLSRLQRPWLLTDLRRLPVLG